ncbi:ATP-dependent RNA helicase HrpA [Alienimonas sp. DA493]|uniref:ATP-dependent RNA helicase HrpA n=1 Tax=Alienimonas sp. DA493 TaxID=3373605 RepID=UPI0037551459
MSDAPPKKRRRRNRKKKSAGEHGGETLPPEEVKGRIDLVVERLNAGVMVADRFKIERGLNTVLHLSKTGKPLSKSLERLERDATRSGERFDERKATVPQVSYPGELPVTGRRDELAEAIRDNQVVVVCGETGSGKSTQLPKICLDLGRGVAGMIGHTQPRRIAARSVASRVGEELGVSNPTVAHKVRFADQTTDKTLVKLMTDGVLLAETQSDRFLNRYDTIIVDEAHERSLNIDFLLGYIKRLLPKRPELRLIVTSATIDVARYSEFFGSGEPGTEEFQPAPVIEVSGRTYPVEMRYRPLPEPDENDNQPDPEDHLADAVAEVCKEGPGDVLVFVPTERDIRDVSDALRGRRLPGGGPTEILPLYGRLSVKEQQKVFKPASGRRIVVATNVAESSLTVPGIRYVVDTGTARISRYAARTGVQRLPIEPVSKASARQRAGRCGRVGPGVCVRLYSEEDFESREEFTPPEIQRSNLAGVILQMATLRLGTIDEFPLLDPPRPASVRDGYETLTEIGALDEEYALTDLGRTLSTMPVDPRIGRMVVAGADEGVLHDVLVIASALEIQDPRDRPVDKKGAADAAHEPFLDSDSDFLTLLNIWNWYQERRKSLSRGKLMKACRQNFLNHVRLREWSDVHRQLADLARSAKLPKRSHDGEKYDPIHRALLAGLLGKAMYRPDDGPEYTAAGGVKCVLWPGSGIFKKKPKWAMAAELVETGRRYARTAARISPSWIEPLAPHVLKYEWSEPRWNPDSGAAQCDEKVTLYGLPVVPRRTAGLAKYDALLARTLFIQHGLVEYDLPGVDPVDGSGGPEFLYFNRQMQVEAEKLQAKARGEDLLVGPQARFEFYDEKLPNRVTDLPRLNKWLKEASEEERDALVMDRSLFIRTGAAEPDSQQYPDALNLSGAEAKIEYRLRPGEAGEGEDEGLTVHVDRRDAHRLSAARLGWLVPGLLAEKVTALIRGLPKDLRTRFVPVPDTAQEVVDLLTFGEGDLLHELSRVLQRIGGERVPVELLEAIELPRHLRMTVRVTGAEGGPATVAVPADGRSEKKLLAPAAPPEQRFHRDGLTQWDFGELPESVQVSGKTLHPGLVDAGTTVSVRLFDSVEKATHFTRGGLRRLLVLADPAGYVAGPGPSALEGSGVTADELRLLVADRALVPGDDPHAFEPPRSDAGWAKMKSAAEARRESALRQVNELAGALVPALVQVKASLDATHPPAWEEAVLDMLEQIDALATPRFVLTTDWPRLTEFPRYVQAANRRFELLKSGDLKGDGEREDRLAPYRSRLERRLERCDDPQNPPGKVAAFRWLVEELRVSLWAPDLGHPPGVIEKRLEKQWQRAKLA